MAEGYSGMERSSNKSTNSARNRFRLQVTSDPESKSLSRFRRRFSEEKNQMSYAPLGAALRVEQLTQLVTPPPVWTAGPSYPISALPASTCYIPHMHLHSALQTVSQLPPVTPVFTLKEGIAGASKHPQNPLFHSIEF
jgi:hypothetical protein